MEMSLLDIFFNAISFSVDEIKKPHLYEFPAIIRSGMTAE